MPVVIDSVDKVQAANRYLASGEGTAEQRAEVEAALQDKKGAIDLGMEINYAWKRQFMGRTLSEEDLLLADEMATVSKRQRDIEAKANAMAIPGGAANAMLEVGEAISDLLGAEDAAQFFSGRQEEIADWTKEYSLNVRREAYGRDLSEGEKEQSNAVADEQLQGLTTASQFALGGAQGKLAMGAKTFWGTLAIGTAESALTASLVIDEDNEDFEQRRADRFGNMKLGAVFGAGVGVITGTAATVRNLIANQVKKFREGSEEAFKLADEFGMPLNLGQATGSPLVQAVQTGAASGNAQKFLANQADALPRAVASKLSIAVKDATRVGANLPGEMGKAFNALNTTIAGIRGATAAGWKQSVQRAKAMGGQGVQMDVQALQGQIGDIMTQLGTKNVRPGKGLTNLMAEIDIAAARGGATIDDIDKWWLQINNFKASPSGSSFARSLEDGVPLPNSMDPTLSTLTGQLSRTLKGSIDEAAGNQEAVSLLKSGRDRWSEGQKIISELNDEVLKPLGFGSNMNHQSVVNALDNINESTLRNAAGYIRRSPDGAMKMREIRTALFESTVATGLGKGSGTQAAQTGMFNVENWVNAFKSTNARAKMSGLLTPKEASNAAEGIRLARIILNEGGAGQRVQHKIVEGLEAWTINLVSRDPAFMGRLLAGALARGKGADALFYTDDGIQILRNLVPTSVRFPRTAAARNLAVIQVGGMLNDGAKEKQFENMERQQSN